VDIVRGDEDVVDVEAGVDEVEGALGTENGDETDGGDGGDGGGGTGNSKISTTFKYPLPLLLPPPKNILF
jgi:hypothetical protein